MSKMDLNFIETKNFIEKMVKEETLKPIFLESKKGTYFLLLPMNFYKNTFLNFTEKQKCDYIMDFGIIMK